MNKRKNIVPNNLKQYRLNAGLTQKEVVKTIGVNSSEQIYHWKKRNNVPKN